MKGIIGIGGALSLGIVIILGAFYVNSNAPGEENGAIVAQASPRTALETQDSDNDGIEDWEEDLNAKLFETIATPTSTILSEDAVEYTAPTTFTGKFSEAFFQDYLEGKIKGTDYTDPAAFIGTAVQAIDQNTQSKRHSQIELTIIPDSPEAIRNYGNEVAEMLKSHSIKNENELVILQKALSANDPKILKGLVPIQEVYEATVADMVKIPVPLSVVPAHIELMNAFEAILMDVTAMQLAFEDPLYALARAKGYPEDSKLLFAGFQGISKILSQNNITYTNEESGRFFSFFNI